MGQNLLNCEFTANPPSNALASLFKEQFRKQFRAIQDTHKLREQFRTPTNLGGAIQDTQAIQDTHKLRAIQDTHSNSGHPQT
jgi:hypothetical protein